VFGFDLVHNNSLREVEGGTFASDSPWCNRHPVHPCGSPRLCCSESAHGLQSLSRIWAQSKSSSRSVSRWLALPLAPQHPQHRFAQPGACCLPPSLLALPFFLGSHQLIFLLFFYYFFTIFLLFFYYFFTIFLLFFYYFFTIFLLFFYYFFTIFFTIFFSISLGV